MKLSKHFTLEECERSQTASRLKIYNGAHPEAIKNLIRLAKKMERVRELLGSPIDVSSAYRSLRLNRAVGGADTSQHMDGLAMDFTSSGYTVKQIVQLIKDSGIKYDQLINEFGSNGGGWVHLSIPTKGKIPRMQSFAII
jgi:zinc D-Ala-D-Ala carboxypeptidase